MSEPGEVGGAVAAFTRHDRYGTLGLAPLTVWEKLRLALLAVTVLPIKLLGAFTCLISFWLCCRFSFLLPASVRTDVIAKLGNWHCRACLWWLGFWRISWVRVGEQYTRRGSGKSRGGSRGGGKGASKGSKGSSRGSSDAGGGDEGPRAVGIVSNHMSWCDILLHMSHSFPAFVARKQTRSTPFVGIISQLMGCLYVDRDAALAKNPGSASSADVSSGGSASTASLADAGAEGGGTARQQRVSDAVRQRMDDMAAGLLPDARPLLLFPEGTTTNGQYLLPFKTGAFLAGHPLQPVVIRYGEDRVSPAWEMIPFARHIFLMLCEPLHSVTCFELPVYQPSPEERADPKLYASNVRQVMLDFSGLKPSTATYTDKMAHMKKLKEQYGLI